MRLLGRASALVLLLVLCGLWVNITARQRRRLDAELAAAAAEHHSLELRLSRTEYAAAASRQSAAHRAAELPAAETRPSRPIAPWDAALEKDPAYQNLFLGAQRFKVAGRYGAYFRRAGLPPETTAKLTQLLVDRAGANMDLQAIARSENLPDDDSSIATLRQQEDAQLQSAEAAILSPPQVQQLRDYERALPAQQAVQTYAGWAAVGGIPLSTAQVDELASVLANASSSYTGGGGVTINAATFQQALQQTQALNAVSPTQFRLMLAMANVQLAENAIDDYLNKNLPAQH